MGDTAQEREGEAWDPLRETGALEEEPAEDREEQRSGRREPQRRCHRSKRKGLFRKRRWSIGPDVSGKSPGMRTQGSPRGFTA